MFLQIFQAQALTAFILDYIFFKLNFYLDVTVDSHAVVKTERETRVPFTRFSPMATSCETTVHITARILTLTQLSVSFRCPSFTGTCVCVGLCVCVFSSMQFYLIWGFLYPPPVKMQKQVYHHKYSSCCLYSPIHCPPSPTPTPRILNSLYFCHFRLSHKMQSYSV